MKDQTRPRPDVTSHRTSIDRHREHMGRGGMRRRPHDAHVCTSSSPRAQPCQNAALVGSDTSGRSQTVSITCPG